ncbi:MAG: TIGR00725 family protein [Thermoplasmatota archaeon]
MYISVIGGQRCTPAIYELAVEVGRRVADMRAVLVTGGLGGVMEAACRGAKEKGGATMGIIPGERRQEANAYCDYVVVTGLGHLRNALVVANGDLVIAIDGGYGTLSEIALATCMGKPLYGLRTWDVDIPSYDSVDELFAALAEDRSSIS